MTLCLRLVVVIALLVAVSEPSEAGYACAVKRTADGFVALRQGPSTRHPIVAKMKPQELVGTLHPDRDGIVKSGDWILVRWYPGTRRTPDHVPDANESTARTGWMRDTLIDCFQ